MDSQYKSLTEKYNAFFKSLDMEFSEIKEEANEIEKSYVKSATSGLQEQVKYMEKATNASNNIKGLTNNTLEKEITGLIQKTESEADKISKAFEASKKFKLFY